MSETQEQEVTEPKAPAEQPAGGEQAPKSDGGEDRGGREFIDFKTSPPEEIEARFKRVYGHMKQSERALSDMAAQNRILVERLEAVEKTTTDGAKNNALDLLRADKKAALEAGNFDRVVEIDEKILDIKTAAEKPKPALPQTQPEGPLNGEQLSRVQDWIREVDGSGNYIRPWAQPGHPLNAKVANLAAAAMEDPEISARGMGAVLEEVDKLMGKTKPVRTAQVLSGDGDIRPPSGKKTALNADERFVASRMFPDLPADKAEARYMDARKKWSK